MTDDQRRELLRPLDTLGQHTPVANVAGHKVSMTPIRRLPASKP